MKPLSVILANNDPLILEDRKTLMGSSHINESFLLQELCSYFKESNWNMTLPQSLSALRNEHYYFFAVSQCTPFTASVEQTNTAVNTSLKFLVSVLAQFTNLNVPLQFSYEKFLFFAVEASSQERQFVSSSITRQLWKRFSSAFNQPCALFHYPHAVTIEGFRKIFQKALPLMRYFSMFYDTQPLNLETLMKTEKYLPLNCSFPFHQLTDSREHLEEQILKIRNYLLLCSQKRDINAIVDFYRGFCTHMKTLSCGTFPANKLRYFYTIESLLKWISNTYQDCINMKSSD